MATTNPLSSDCDKPLDNAGFELSKGDEVLMIIPDALAAIYMVGSTQRVTISDIVYYDGTPYVQCLYRGAILLSRACKVRKVIK